MDAHRTTDRGLLSLATELLLYIFRFADSESALGALRRTCRLFWQLGDDLVLDSPILHWDYLGAYDEHGDLISPCFNDVYIASFLGSATRRRNVRVIRASPIHHWSHQTRHDRGQMVHSTHGPKQFTSPGDEMEYCILHLGEILAACPNVTHVRLPTLGLLGITTPGYIFNKRVCLCYLAEHRERYTKVTHLEVRNVHENYGGLDHLLSFFSGVQTLCTSFGDLRIADLYSCSFPRTLTVLELKLDRMTVVDGLYKRALYNALSCPSIRKIHIRVQYETKTRFDIDAFSTVYLAWWEQTFALHNTVRDLPSRVAIDILVRVDNMPQYAILQSQLRTLGEIHFAITAVLPDGQTLSIFTGSECGGSDCASCRQMAINWNENASSGSILPGIMPVL